MSNFDDETQFWDEPVWTRTGQQRAVGASGSLGALASGDDTGSVRRTADRTPATGQHRFERTRTHRVVQPPTQALSYDDVEPDDWSPIDHWIVPEHNAARGIGVDPRLLRIGAVAAVGVLMIPLALAIREDPDKGSLTAATIPSTVVPQVLAAPAETVVTVPVTAAVAPSVAVAAASSSAGSSSSSGSSGSGSVAGAGSSAAAVASQQAQQPAAPACAGTYTVIANDYWNRFPKSSGASVQKWLAANNATADTPLYVGDELCIPVGATAPAPPPVTTQPPQPTEAPTTAAPVATAAPVTTPPAPVTTQPPAPPVTTAAPPAVGPPAVAPPAAAPASPGTVEALIREIWPDDIEERALTIAKRESGLNPNVHNYCCYGVFAIYFEMGKNFLPQLGITSPEQLFDPRTNITAAYKLYTLAGWKPWVQTDPGT